MPQPKDTEINGQKLGAIVEAILFAADKPLTADDIAKAITETELAPPIDEDDIAAVINQLVSEYEEQGRAFSIHVQGGGYTFATLPVYHTWLERFQHQNAKRKISPSAVETLAIIAYRQPVTKPEVDHIRGVDSGYIVRQLLEKQLIEVAGRYEGPGRALLYRTTPIFLQHFGINSIDELPKPREIEEILRDDDMAEHRQLMLELKSDLLPPFPDSSSEDGSQGEPGQQEDAPSEDVPSQQSPSEDESSQNESTQEDPPQDESSQDESSQNEPPHDTGSDYNGDTNDESSLRN